MDLEVLKDLKLRLIWLSSLHVSCKLFISPHDLVVGVGKIVLAACSIAGLD